MKKVLVLIAALTLLGAFNAFAQTASDSISVTATNNGIFTFSIDLPSYAFGTVDANGTSNAATGGTETLGGTRVGTAATYTSGALGPNWTAASAPSRTVRIYNASTIVSGVLGGNRLALEVPAGGGGSTCGFKAFGTTGDGAACAAGILIHSMTVGNGGQAVGGDLNLRLTIDDTDPVGATTWTVVLTASAT